MNKEEIAKDCERVLRNIYAQYYEFATQVKWYNEGYTAGLAAGEEARQELWECLKLWYDARQLQGICTCEFCKETAAILQKHEKESGD